MKINSRIIQLVERETELLVVPVELSIPNTKLDPEFKAGYPGLTPVPVLVPGPIPNRLCMLCR